MISSCTNTKSAHFFDLARASVDTFGDVCGPTITQVDIYHRVMVFAVSAFAPSEKHKLVPSVHTRIAPYLPWIRETARKFDTAESIAKILFYPLPRWRSAKWKLIRLIFGQIN